MVVIKFHHVSTHFHPSQGLGGYTFSFASSAWWRKLPWLCGLVWYPLGGMSGPLTHPCNVIYHQWNAFVENLCHVWVYGLIAHPHLLMWANNERWVPTLAATNQWFSMINLILKVVPIGRNRSLVANTSKCGWAISCICKIRVDDELWYSLENFIIKIYLE